MGKWLKLKEFFAPAQYKEGAAFLELSEHHTSMHIELFDTHDGIVSSFHVTKDTLTVTEKE